MTDDIETLREVLISAGQWYLRNGALTIGPAAEAGRVTADLSWRNTVG
jgi:hypothetical protein